jgi:hypothetical protein
MNLQKISCFAKTAAACLLDNFPAWRISSRVASAMFCADPKYFSKRFEAACAAELSLPRARTFDNKSRVSGLPIMTNMLLTGFLQSHHGDTNPLKPMEQNFASCRSNGRKPESAKNNRSIPIDGAGDLFSRRIHHKLQILYRQPAVHLKHLSCDIAGFV